MSKISKRFVIAAPAAAVWSVIGPGFAGIGEWATAIPAATGIAHATPDLLDAAPVAARMCTTGLRLVPEVTETLVAYDDHGRTLTYEASGLPSYVTHARNTWTVTPVDDRQCVVTLDARFDTRGIVGVLARWALLIQLGRTSQHLGDDLRHYVEHGSPSPRKRAALARTARAMN